MIIREVAFGAVQLVQLPFSQLFPILNSCVYFIRFTKPLANCLCFSSKVDYTNLLLRLPRMLCLLLFPRLVENPF